MTSKERDPTSAAAEAGRLNSRQAGALKPVPVTPRRGVTLKEVAVAAGVATSTVSRVLSGVATDITVTRATRDRILSHAQSLGYRPNPLARGLRGSTTAMLGLIVRDFGYPLHGPLVQRIVEAARAVDLHVVVGSSSGLSSEERQLERILETRMCDGVIMIGGLDEGSAALDELRYAGIPLVGIGLATTDPATRVVRSDNAAGARLAFDHLAGLGHREIAILVAGLHPELVDRRDAFLAAAETTWGRQHAIHVRTIRNTSAAAHAACLELLQGRHPPTAIFATTDWTAFAVLETAASIGVRVPDALSVVGFDDQVFGAVSSPPLTTVRQDLRELARRAVAEIGAAILGRAVSAADREPVPVMLIERRSTTAPHR